MQWPWHILTAVHTFSVTSPLSPRQCAQRMHVVTSPLSGFSARSARFIGTITEDTFDVLPRFVSADLKTSGLFIPDETGTIIAYQTTINPILMLQGVIALLLLGSGLVIRGVLLLPIPLPPILTTAPVPFLWMVGLVFFAIAMIGLTRFVTGRTHSEYAMVHYLQSLLGRHRAE